jgi:hypothetical protein
MTNDNDGLGFIFRFCFQKIKISRQTKRLIREKITYDILSVM